MALSKVKNFILSHEKSEIYKYIFIYLGALVALFALLVFWHNSSINAAKANYKKINTERIKTKKLLSNYIALQEQQKELNKILEQTKNFRIIEAYNKIINDLKLNKYIPETPEPVENKTGNYIERKLPININGITIKQLVELLNEIQKYKRLFTKELTITTTPLKKINVVLVIATLEEIATQE